MNIELLDEVEIDEILENDDDLNPLESAIRIYGSIQVN